MFDVSLQRRILLRGAAQETMSSSLLSGSGKNLQERQDISLSSSGVLIASWLMTLGAPEASILPLHRARS